MTSPETGRPAGSEPGWEPLLPEQSREDTDAGWGEYPDSSDGERCRDRPPHWDNF